jgi:hypothetical protein
MSKETALQMTNGTTPAPTEAPPAAAAPAQPTETKADDIQSSRFAIHAKKEAQLVKDREALKKEREEWLAQKKQADDILAKGKLFDETFAKDPVEALKLLGYSEAQIYNIIAEGANPKEKTPEEIAREAARLEIEENEKKRKDSEAQAQRERDEKVIAKLKTDITDTLKKKADKYEYCAFEGPDAEAQVFEIIAQNLEINKELLSIDEAFDILEEYYEKRDQEMSKLKKRQPKPQPEPTPDDEPAPAAAKSATPKTAAKTLTNQVTATVASTIPAKRETRSQLKDRLAKRLAEGVPR